MTIRKHNDTYNNAMMTVIMRVMIDQYNKYSNSNGNTNILIVMIFLGLLLFFLEFSRFLIICSTGSQISI